MLTKRNPTGWADDLDTATAAQLNGLDADHAQAVDGVGGGTYAPANKIVIQGAGLEVNPLLNTTQTGTATRGSAGHFPDRVSKNLYVDANFNAAAHQLVDTKFDEFWFNGVMTQDWNIDLAIASAQSPVDRDVVMVSIAVAGAGVVRIRSEGDATQIARFPTAYSFQQTSTPIWARFWFDAGSNIWRPLEFSGDVLG